MKKLFIGTILVAICLVFTACGTDKVDLALSNLAEVRYNVFSGENDRFTATFMSGQRENPYIVNGICQERVDFGMLTIKFKTADRPMVAQYRLTVNDKEYTGNLEYNNYDGTLMVDIQQVVADDATIKLTVITDQEEISCDIAPKTTNLEITWRSALEIALAECSEQYKNYISKGKLNGEVYVKIITDLNASFDTYYWYVSIVGTNGSTIGVIIDPHTGQVIAKNI